MGDPALDLAHATDPHEICTIDPLEEQRFGASGLCRQGLAALLGATSFQKLARRPDPSLTQGLAMLDPNTFDCFDGRRRCSPLPRDDCFAVLTLGE